MQTQDFPDSQSSGDSLAFSANRREYRMKEAQKVIKLIMVVAVVSVLAAGCKKKAEHPSSEHPTKEHPAKEAAAKEHPEHPAK